MGVEDDRLARLSKVAWDLYGQRRYRESAVVFKGLTVLDPERIDLYRGLALAASRDNDLVTAVASLETGERLLRDRPRRAADRSYLLALLATLLYRSGRRREAAERAQEALALAPADAAWARPLADGIERAEKVLLRTPKRSAAETETVRRMLRARLAEVGRGQATLARALGYVDEELVHVFDNGAALLEAGQPRRASRIFEGLVELDGGVPLFHLALGQARELAGHNRRAASAYDQAVATARRVEGGGDLLADALLRRARHRFKRGKRRSCRRDVDEALGLPATEQDADLLGRAQKLDRALRGAGGGEALGGDLRQTRSAVASDRVKRVEKSGTSKEVPVR